VAQKLGEMSPDEFEALIERAIDRRLQVWLTQVMDALGLDDEGEAELRPEFAAGLRRAIDEAGRGDVTDLETFLARIES
jgi:hypothetical protein